MDRKERWNRYYTLAKKYYEHYGNINIPYSFKTLNGIDYDENGLKLGAWLMNQKSSYKGKTSYKLTSERIILLKKIGVQFESNDQKWMRYYNLAKKNYEYYGELKISPNFKTTNGIDYDEKGINLGRWLTNIKQAYRGQNRCTLTEERIELLNSIGVTFKSRDNDQLWLNNYKLAESYYNYYGNLEMSSTFITKNGIDYDKDGIKLGIWLINQRQIYNGKRRYSMKEERVELLRKIGMRFDIKDTSDLWMDTYELAKKYYEHYGNLEIPCTFKTINGIDYDETC